MKIADKLRSILVLSLCLILLVPSFVLGGYVNSPGFGEIHELLPVEGDYIGFVWEDTIDTRTRYIKAEEVDIETLNDEPRSKGIASALRAIVASAADLGGIGEDVNNALDKIAAKKNDTYTSEIFVVSDIFGLIFNDEVSENLKNDRDYAFVNFNNGTKYGEKPVILFCDANTGTWSVVDPELVILNDNGTVNVSVKSSGYLAVLEYAEIEPQEYDGVLEVIPGVINMSGYVAVATAVDEFGNELVYDVTSNPVYIYDDESESYSSVKMSGAPIEKAALIEAARDDVLNALDPSKKSGDLDGAKLALRKLLDEEAKKINGDFSYDVFETSDIYYVFLYELAGGKAYEGYLKYTINTGKSYTKTPVVIQQGSDGTWHKVENVTLNPDGTITIVGGEGAFAVLSADESGAKTPCKCWICKVIAILLILIILFFIIIIFGKKDDDDEEEKKPEETGNPEEAAGADAPIDGETPPTV